MDYESRRVVECSDKKAVFHIRSLYDAEIRELDSEIIGPVIDNLKHLGIYDRTIIVVASDHGDEFCEHGGIGHGGTAYEEVIRVPLIIRLPWLKSGIRISRLTLTIDLMPTLLDILRVQIPDKVQGLSLAPAVEGHKGWKSRDSFMANYPPGLLTYRDNRWKFTVSYDGKRELYDLQSDPEEQGNIFADNIDLALKTESELRKWRESLPSYGIDRPFLPRLDEYTRKKIRRTGYW